MISCGRHRYYPPVLLWAVPPGPCARRGWSGIRSSTALRVAPGTSQRGDPAETQASKLRYGSYSARQVPEPRPGARGPERAASALTVVPAVSPVVGHGRADAWGRAAVVVCLAVLSCVWRVARSGFYRLPPTWCSGRPRGGTEWT